MKTQVIPFKSFVNNTWRAKPLTTGEKFFLLGVAGLQVMLVGLVKQGVESGFLPPL